MGSPRLHFQAIGLVPASSPGGGASSSSFGWAQGATQWGYPKHSSSPPSGQQKPRGPLLILETAVIFSKNGRDLDEDFNEHGFAMDAAAIGDLVYGSLLHH